MKKWILPPLAALCILLSGCGALLERSYSSVEPYANRYWDSGAEDTLRAESYQDLVNSLLMLVEQRAEEGTIRCYEEANSYIQAQRARTEVRRETTLGSYLLEGLLFNYESGTAYSTVTYQMTYREGTEDVEGLMSISDIQSLLDLLRLAVREQHRQLTAHFSYDTPTADVIAAVEGLWQELWLGERGAVPTLSAGEEVLPEGEQPAQGDANQELPPRPDSGEAEPPGTETAPQLSEAESASQLSETASNPSEEGNASQPPKGETASRPPENAGEPSVPPEGEGTQEPPGSGSEEPPGEGEAPGEGAEPGEEAPALECPPCPWTIRFYPAGDSAEIVEIQLNGQWPKA